MSDQPSHLPELETTEKPVFLLEMLTAISLVVALLSLFFFAWIAEGISRDRTMHFDLTVRDWVHAHSTPWLTGAMKLVSQIGGDFLTVFTILCFALFLYFRWRRAALWLLVTFVGTLVLDLGLKYTFHRPRPIPFFVDAPKTPSFPSGHSLFSFCLFGVMAGLLAGRVLSIRFRILIWTVAALLVGAIGFSRIYLGVHYPSDVIAGYLVGFLWMSTMIFVDRLHKHRKSKRTTLSAGH